MTADTTLAPCPFCNAAAHFESDSDGWHWIECESCGMQGNRSASLMEDCRPKLREAWNTRNGVHPDVASRYAEGWEDGMTEATKLMAESALVPLTDEQFVACIKQAGFKTWDSRMWTLKHAIEAAHGITGAPNGKPT